MGVEVVCRSLRRQESPLVSGYCGLGYTTVLHQHISTPQGLAEGELPAAPSRLRLWVTQLLLP